MVLSKLSYINFLLMYFLFEHSVNLYFLGGSFFKSFFFQWRKLLVYCGYKFFVIYMDKWFWNIFYFMEIFLSDDIYFLLWVSESCSVMSEFLWPITVAPQAPLSMGFPKPVYWSGLPFPSTGEGSSRPRYWT